MTDPLLESITDLETAKTVLSAAMQRVSTTVEENRKLKDRAVDLRKRRDELATDVVRLREELALIAVMGHSDDPKVAANIAKAAVTRAQDALKVGNR